METLLLSAVLLLLTSGGGHTFLLQSGSGNNGHVDCSSIREYNTLMHLITTENCVSINHVLPLIEDVYNKGHKDCRVKVINSLAAKFGHGTTTPSRCRCNGAEVLQRFHQSGVTDIWKDWCAQHIGSYNELYQEFFTHRGQNHVHACRTHHSLWYPLSRIPHDRSYCQLDIVQHMGHAFRSIPDPCTCTGGHAGHSVLTTAAPVVHVATDPHSELPCLKYESYNNTKRLITQDRCLDANKVWTGLQTTSHLDRHCLHVLLQHMRSAFDDAKTLIPHECQCSGNVNNHNIPRLSDGYITYCRHDLTFMDLERKLFDNRHQYGCSTHQFLWKNLMHIHSQHGHSCVGDLIRRAATNTYFPCHCESRHVTSPTTTTTTPTTTTTTPTTTTTTPTTTTTTPTTTTTTPTTTTTTPTTTTTTPTTTSTTTTTPTTTTTAPTTTVVAFEVHTSCSKLTTIESIGTATSVTHPDTTSCVGRTSGSNEAFALVHCNVSPFQQWVKGPNVMQSCAQIPPFTPIATFPPGSDSYAPNGAESGVFIGCLAHGFKIAVQNCTSVPTIEHLVTGGVFTSNPDAYYVIG